MAIEKPVTIETEHIDEVSGPHDDIQPVATEATEHSRFEDLIGFEADLEDLPKGYYYSKYFLGSFCATGVGLWCAVSTFGFVAPLLGVINNDLGPDPRYIWISLIYNAVLAVFLAPVGRLSDIFGRRYFFIGGGVAGVIGSIVCATAKSIPALIGGNVILGVSTATQLSFHFVIGELVPMRHRYLVGAIMYVFGYPGSGFGPVYGTIFMKKYPSVGWRGVYWILLGGQVLALVLWTCFYFPPSFRKKHKADNTSKLYWIKNFDYIGTLLFSGGFIVFLLGLSWGGSVYPWRSAAVIASIVGGLIVMVIFFVWEVYGPVKEPLIPVHLFKSGRWVASCVLLGIGAAVYYAFAIIWPMQAAVMYSNGDEIRTGLISSIVGLGIITGQAVGGVVARPIGKAKLQCMAMFLIAGVFLGCMALTGPDNMNTAISLLFLGCFFIGWNETICLANATLLVHDQREIGIAGGLAGTIRGFLTSVLVAIYTTILTNRLTTTVSRDVPAALVSAGLPGSSVAKFLGAITAGTPDAFKAVPGVTDAITAVGLRAYKIANADAFRTVYLTTIAFSVLGLALTWFAPNTEEFMSDKIGATLANEDNAFGSGKDVEKKVSPAYH